MAVPTGTFAFSIRAVALALVVGATGLAVAGCQPYPRRNFRVVHRVRLSQMERAPAPVVDPVVRDEPSFRVLEPIAPDPEPEPLPDPEPEVDYELLPVFTKQGVIDMVTAEIPEEIVLLAIDHSRLGFELDTATLIELHEAGVSETITNALFARQDFLFAAGVTPPIPGDAPDDGLPDDGSDS